MLSFFNFFQSTQRQSIASLSLDNSTEVMDLPNEDCFNLKRNHNHLLNYAKSLVDSVVKVSKYF